MIHSSGVRSSWDVPTECPCFASSPLPPPPAHNHETTQAPPPSAGLVLYALLQTPVVDVVTSGQANRWKGAAIYENGECPVVIVIGRSERKEGMSVSSKAQGAPCLSAASIE